jgi:proteasome accessory factor A
MQGHLFGIETEYGCLPRLSKADSPDRIIHRVKDHLFRARKAGLLDLHHRAHDEPPGNGGFLLNGGRLYIDMGHIEYASPECTRLSDLVAYDRAGDLLLQRAIEEMGIAERISFIKNNIDYETGATFGSHENYLVSRDFPFTLEGLGRLIPFLVTRQVFTGTGRIGANLDADGLISVEEKRPRGALPAGKTPKTSPTPPFQISQRADHIINDFYQWVQFNRAIVNTRDEPLADPGKYRRIHLLLGDSNLSEFATALKVGTTALVLDLIQLGSAPEVPFQDPVFALKSISRDPARRWEIATEGGGVTTALEVQWAFLDAAKEKLTGRDDETDWVLEAWEGVLRDLSEDYASLVGRVDWASKLWLLERFVEAEALSWDDPWLKSLDLEYHNLDPSLGLYFGLEEEGRVERLTTSDCIEQATLIPPADTRAAGRASLARRLLENPVPYVINWTSFYVDGRNLPMPDPFQTYLKEAKQFLK